MLVLHRETRAESICRSEDTADGTAGSVHGLHRCVEQLFRPLVLSHRTLSIMKTGKAQLGQEFLATNIGAAKSSFPL